LNSGIALTIWLGVTADLVLAKTASMCPWSVGTLLQLAETVIPAGFDVVPSILLVSCSTFSSSFLMNGMTFCMMSRDATPGYPAPDTACIEDTTTVSSPYLSCRGLRDRVRIAVVLLGLATMKPSVCIFRFCSSTITACSGFASGFRSGTYWSILCDD